MRAKRVVLLVMVLSLVLLGCGFDFGTSATPTNTPQPAATVAPTDTPVPEKVVEPTNTPKAEKEVVPTDTPEPVAEPTDTPQAEPAATRSGIARPTAEVGGVEVKPTTDGGQGGIVKKGETISEDVLQFVSHTAWVDDYGSISIVGEAENVSGQTIDTMVAVMAVLTDADGETVPGDFGAYLDRPAIAPGDVSSFWVYIGSEQLGDVDVDSITDYELTFWVTQDPSPDVEIAVAEADVYEEDGLLYIRGTATNDTDLSFAGLSVYSTLYDAGGSVVNVTVDYISLDRLLKPGDDADFEGYFIDHFEDADSFYVVVTGWTAEQTGGVTDVPSDELQSGDYVFSIDDHTGWIDEYGNVNIVGYVTNESSETIDTLVFLQAVLTDVDGNDLEGEYTTYLDRPSIAPGDWSSFWLWVSADDLGGVDPDTITDYELLTWITDQPSPDVELYIEYSSGTIEDDAYYVDGVVTNQTDLEFVALAVYSSIYDDYGNILNSTVDIIDLGDYPLEPGDSTDFQGYFVDHFEDAASYAVIVTGYTREATGQ